MKKYTRSDYNHISITGSLTDQSQKHIGNVEENGRTKTSFIIRVERPQELKSAQPYYDYINCVAWAGLADFIFDQRRGSIVKVDGMLTLHSHLIDGEKKWITEIVADNIELIR